MTLVNAIDAHEIALQRHGGRPGILDQGLIEAAVARPYSGYYPKIEQKAAALAQSVASNHGFNDGNKRTALLLTVTLIAESGYELAPLAGEDINTELENIILDIVTHTTQFDDLVKWFRDRIRRI